MLCRWGQQAALSLSLSHPAVSSRASVGQKDGNKQSLKIILILELAIWPLVHLCTGKPV